MYLVYLPPTREMEDNGYANFLSYFFFFLGGGGGKQGAV